MQTKRLVLRDFRDRDLPAWHAIVAHPDAVRFMHFPPQSARRSRASFKEILATRRAVPRVAYYLAMTTKSEGTVIGWVAIQQESDVEWAFGYMVHPAFWGQGYATEACRGLIEFASTALRVRSMSANVHADNLASVRVLEKVGARLVRRAVGTDAKTKKPYTRLEYEILCHRDRRNAALEP